MKVEFDWIIEAENLPEGSSQLSDPFHRELGPVRRLDRRFWLLGGLLTVVGGFLLVLWSLGGRRGPLPGPDHPEIGLRAAIQLEIDALERADLDIYNQFQDRSWRRSIMQPPPEAWIANRGENNLKLIDVDLIDESSAWARVELTWERVNYQLIWFYRHVDGRWRHCDWQELNTGPTEVLSFPHVQITHQQIHQAEASALGERLEALLDDYCRTLECPAEQSLFKVTLDPLFSAYYAQDIAPMSYRIPSPTRVRWPKDDQPEPLILASVGRHMAYDLFARPHETRTDPENITALTLSTFWLAHYLLGHEPVPTIRWLEEACRRDGLPAAAAFIDALSRDRSPQLALSSSFQPATVADIHALPDYYGWLALVTDPADRIRPQPGPYSTLPIRWYQDLHTRLDLSANPWAVEKETFDRATPEIAKLILHPDWVIAIPHENSDWGTVYYFTAGETGWTLARPDENLMGEQRMAYSGPFAVTYWTWDVGNLDKLLRSLDRVYQVVGPSLGLQSRRKVSVLVFSAPEVANLPAVAADLFLASPALADLLGREIKPDADAAVRDTLAALLLNEFEEKPISGIYLIQAIYHWELLHLERELGSVASPELELATLLESWRPPSDIYFAEWRTLAELWSPPPGTQERELHVYASLLVSYLVEEHGEENLPLMLGALRSSATMAEWVTAVSGRSMAAFEEDWRRWAIGY